MATRPRGQSGTGYYHVFQRGVNRFDIFEDDADRSFFTSKLADLAGRHGVEVHAWCMMSNHVHLLVRAGLADLSSLMRDLGSVYVRRFNTRHGRSGPLFEGRFCSVCIETESQFLAVLRYIHRNPVHHKEASLDPRYRWSSYREYAMPVQGMCETSIALSLLGGRAALLRFHGPSADDGVARHLDIGASGLMVDDEARLRSNRLLEALGLPVPVSKVGSLPALMRDRVVLLMREKVGCSLRQIRRLTALSASVVKHATATAGPSLRLA